MGLFSKFFGAPSRTATPADLSVLKCDVHSHFIPGIDDGARSMEDSLQFLRAFAEMGYKKVITTPHVMSDFYRNTPDIILGGLEKVRLAVQDHQIPIEVAAAAEYYIDFDFEEKIHKKTLLTFGKNYVLVEISFINPPENLNDIFFKLLTNGYKPVLAHPERYNFWHHDFEKYEEIAEKGVLLQLNINSLTGHYSPATKKIAERMIEKNMISLLGSDCHHGGHTDLMKQVVYEPALHKLLASGKLLNPTL
jgi:tyrosine-protein phosphatase YwqE